MERKYYTPTIEEFHVGFEYEQYMISSIIDGEKSKWVEKKIQELEDLMECDNSLALEGNIDAKYCRVKLLDIEDIESLGWVFYYQNSNLKRYTYEKLPYRISVNFIKPFTTVDIYTNDSEMVNSIRIKNKSELCKLLIQLRIK